MLLLKIALYSLTLSHAPAALAAPAHSLEEISWLAGSWEGSADGADVDYQYGEAKGGLLLGQGRFTAGGQVVFFEFETLKEEGGELTLTPSPFGQPGLTFTATAVEPNRVVFICPDHDFPQVIEYKLLDDGTLYSKAAGTENGAPKVLEFVQRRSLAKGI